MNANTTSNLAIDFCQPQWLKAYAFSDTYRLRLTCSVDTSPLHEGNRYLTGYATMESVLPLSLMFKKSTEEVEADENEEENQTD